MTAVHPDASRQAVVEAALALLELVQAVTVDQMPAELAMKWRQAAAALIKGAIPDNPILPDTWLVCIALLPHARAALADDSDAVARIVGGLEWNLESSLARYKAWLSSCTTPGGEQFSAVVNQSRSVLRQRTTVDQTLQQARPHKPSAEDEILVLLQRSDAVAALGRLPMRQRDAIVLRYYSYLSEAEIATVMRISPGDVKSYTARGISALRAAIEQESL